MADTIPKYDDFMQPTLSALRSLGGSASIDEIADRIASDLGLTERALGATYPRSGAAIVPDRMSWARSHMKIAGLLASGGKGVWVLTDAGRDASEWPPSVLKAKVKELSAPHHAEVAARRARTRGLESDDQTADVAEARAGAPEVAAEEAQDEWRNILLGELRGLHPAAFERLAQRLLRESGFVKVEVTGKSGDGGIDGTGVLRMNLISFQVLFQCKRYQGSVGAGAVRDFRGAMQGRADKGLIITTGTFTGDARREATRDGAPAIDLIDGDALCDLLKDAGLGVAVQPVTTYRISIDKGFFESV